MGKVETTPQENIEHEQPPSAAAPSTPHSHTTSSSSSSSLNSEDIDKTPAVAFPPEPAYGHAPPSSNQPVQGASEIAAVRRQKPELGDGIESIPAVAFPPQPRPAESNNKEGAGGGGGDDGPVAAATLGREKSGKAHLVLIQGEGNPWSSGLFDCCQHPLNAMITTIAPCVTFGQIVEVVDNGSTSCVTGAALYFSLFLVICHWNIGVRYRRRLRNAYQLAEMPLTDRFAHIIFPLCALCQEFRELKNQGYDPFLGYKGIAAKIQEQMQQQQSMNGSAIPPTTQTMMR